MTPEDVKRIREGLGMNQRQLALAIRLGYHGDRTIRRWEKGEIPVAGPASLALEFLEKKGVGFKKNS